MHNPAIYFVSLSRSHQVSFSGLAGEAPVQYGTMRSGNGERTLFEAVVGRVI